MSTFPNAEFHRFRWAHARTNELLYGTGIAIGLFAGIVRWVLKVESDWGFTTTEFVFLLLFGAVFSVIPRLGYYLARHVVGPWYQPEHFGDSYRAYRRIEQEQLAASK